MIAETAQGLDVQVTCVIPAADERGWQVQRILVDHEEQNDWVAGFEVDLARFREAAAPVLRLAKLGSLA